MSSSTLARAFVSLAAVMGAGSLIVMSVAPMATASMAVPSAREPSHADSASCDGTLPAGTVVGIAATKDDGGYWIANSEGLVVACGDATDFGDLTTTPAHPIVGITATPDEGGFYLVASDGGVFTFGDAVFEGSTGAMRLNRPVVGMAVDPTTGGYWLVASDGGIFSFNAPFYGSTGSIVLNEPVVGMAESNGGSGYWLVAADGGIFAFNATFWGSTGSLRLNKPVVGMAPDPSTGGYWLVASDGGIFSFSAPFYGSTGNLTLNRPIVGMESNDSGTGYRFVGSDGGVFDFGTSGFFGSAVAPLVVTPPPPPPATTSVLIPANGATLSGVSDLDASASNATSVEFRIFGGIYGYSGAELCAARAAIDGWLCAWNTATVPDGSYVLESEAFNSVGSSFSSGVNITINNPLPTTSILIPANGATLSGSTYLDASASYATSVEFWILGGSYGYTGKMIGTATATIYGWLWAWNTATVPDGSYTLVSEAFNSAGSAFSSGVSITVKN